MSQFFASGGQSIGASASNEYSRLISFTIDWLDLLAAQGTLKSHPQHHSSKASILQCSAFFTVELSNPCMTTGKTIAYGSDLRLIENFKIIQLWLCEERFWDITKNTLLKCNLVVAVQLFFLFFFEV